MYFSGCPCVQCQGAALSRGGGLAGLSAMGQDPFSIASGALTLLKAFNGATPSGHAPGVTPGSAGDSGGAVITTTSVSTQVSPQISPTFVQQTNPSNSPVNANASQNAPFNATPQTGAMPGFDTASGFLPTGLPAIPSPIAAASTNTGKYIFIGAAALLGVAVLFKKRPKLKTYRSTSHALAQR